MKLSKALRVKNQLVLQIVKLQSRIKQNNSYDTENIPKWKVLDSYEELETLKAKLIQLKTKISLANRPILTVIHTMEETKADIAFMKELPTKSGVCKSSYSDTKQEFACFMNDVVVSRIITEALDLMFSLQDKLAEHNAKTEIDV